LYCWKEGGKEGGRGGKTARDDTEEGRTILIERRERDNMTYRSKEGIERRKPKRQKPQEAKEEENQDSDTYTRAFIIA